MNQYIHQHPYNLINLPTHPLGNPKQSNQPPCRLHYFCSGPRQPAGTSSSCPPGELAEFAESPPHEGSPALGISDHGGHSQYRSFHPYLLLLQLQCK